MPQASLVGHGAAVGHLPGQVGKVKLGLLRNVDLDQIGDRERQPERMTSGQQGQLGRLVLGEPGRGLTLAQEVQGRVPAEFPQRDRGDRQPHPAFPQLLLDGVRLVARHRPAGKHEEGGGQRLQPLGQRVEQRHASNHLDGVEHDHDRLAGLPGVPRVTAREHGLDRVEAADHGIAVDPGQRLAWQPAHIVLVRTEVPQLGVELPDDPLLQVGQQPVPRIIHIDRAQPDHIGVRLTRGRQVPHEPGLADAAGAVQQHDPARSLFSDPPDLIPDLPLFVVAGDIRREHVLRVHRGAFACVAMSISRSRRPGSAAVSSCSSGSARSLAPSTCLSSPLLAR